MAVLAPARHRAIPDDPAVPKPCDYRVSSTARDIRVPTPEWKLRVTVVVESRRRCETVLAVTAFALAAVGPRGELIAVRRLMTGPASLLFRGKQERGPDPPHQDE